RDEPRGARARYRRAGGGAQRPARGGGRGARRQGGEIGEAGRVARSAAAEVGAIPIGAAASIAASARMFPKDAIDLIDRLRMILSQIARLAQRLENLATSGCRSFREGLFAGLRMQLRQDGDEDCGLP